MEDEGKSYLTTSWFMMGVRCPKALHLLKYHPELATPINANLKMQFEDGDIDFDDNSKIQDSYILLSKVESTEALPLTDRTFIFDDIIVKVEVLSKEDTGWCIGEFRKVTSINEMHVIPLALKYYVLKGIGIDVQTVYLSYLNKDYVLLTTEPDMRELTIIVDVTEDVKALHQEIKEEIEKQKSILNGKILWLALGRQCDEPYPCIFKTHCWKHVKPDSPLMLRGRCRGGVDKYYLYYSMFRSYKDVPVEFISPSQQVQINGIEIINKDKIREFLKTLWYPMCFLDFETCNTPIPKYIGTKPYQMLPFQFSLHVMVKEGEDAEHYDYIAVTEDDFRREFLETLLGLIPDNACVVVYNKSFERNILKSLQSWFTEHTDRIQKIIDNLVDLMTLFKNQDVYYPEFNGSYSIKSVIKKLAPELAYDALPINNGRLAMDAFHKMVQSANHDERETIQKNLLEYCKNDTLAMIRIIEKLGDMAV